MTSKGKEEERRTSDPQLGRSKPRLIAQSSKAKTDSDLKKRHGSKRMSTSKSIDFGDLLVQPENKAASLRKAHLHWLIDNNVYSNGIYDYQHNLRQHSPSNSARYPMRMSKDQIDPEWDYRVHIFHCQRDASWVEQWLKGMLEVRRYLVTTNNEPFEDCDRVIIILSNNFSKAKKAIRKAAEGVRGRISLGIKIDASEEPSDVKDRCLGYIDMSRVSMFDYSFQYQLMNNVVKCLFLPQSVGSA